MYFLPLPYGIATQFQCRCRKLGPWLEIFVSFTSLLSDNASLLGTFRLCHLKASEPRGHARGSLAPAMLKPRGRKYLFAPAIICQVYQLVDSQTSVSLFMTPRSNSRTAEELTWRTQNAPKLGGLSSVTLVHPAKAAGRKEMPFGISLRTPVGEPTALSQTP